MKRILHDVGMASWKVTLNSTPTLPSLMNIPKRVVQPENISYFNITWWQTGKTKGILLFATIIPWARTFYYRGEGGIKTPMHPAGTTGGAIKKE